MKYIKTTIYFIFLLSVISCTESETEKSIRDMVFNQNNTAIGNNLPTSNVLSFSPASYNYGTVQNGTNNMGVIAITNSHSEPVNVTVTHTNSITQISISIATFQIPANGTYQYPVVFNPTATMFLNDTLHFSYPANVSNSTGPIVQNVNLTGNSVATLSTTLTVLPAGTIDFGTVINGQTATRYIQLTNSGSSSATWSPVGSTLSFAPSSGTIAVGSSQQVSLTLTANGTGIYNNTQTFSYNGGTVQVPYTVNRVAATRIIGVSCTTSTSFGNVSVNNTSQKIIVITNTGNSPLNVASITVQSTPSNQFTCNYSGTIAPNTSVQVPIIFKPTATGSKTCSIIVQSDKTAGTNNLTFSGFGI